MHRVLLVFLALSLLCTAEELELEQTPGTVSCYKYQCNYDEYSMLNSTCVMYLNGIFYLQLCNDKATPYCIPLDQPNNNSTCQPSPPNPIAYAWPGEACKQNADCAYGTCQQGQCFSLTQGKTCALNDQCNPGLYCGNQNQCVPLVALNQSCTEDYQCVNNAGCNFNSTTGKGVCTEYLSIDSYEPVGPCLNNSNMLCGSGTCGYYSAREEYVCIPELPSYAQPPLKCTNDGDCFSIPDFPTGTVLTSECTCSYNPWGMSFCKLFPGDEIGITVRKYLYDWFKSGNFTACNTERRMSLNCLQTHMDTESYLWLAYHMIWYSDFSYVQFLDPCGQQIYQQDYWSIKYDFNHYRSNFTDLDDYSAAAALAVTLWTLSG